MDSNVSVAQSNAGKQPKNIIAVNKADGSRKLGQSSNDANQSKRAPPTKAWSGVNPITNRASTSATQNGYSSNKPAKSGERSESENSASVAHSRLVFLLSNAIGNHVTLTLTNGDVYQGIFFGASLDKPEPEYLIKMAKIVKKHEKGDMNGLKEEAPDFVGVGEDHAMSFKVKDVLDLPLDASAIKLQDRPINGANSTFRTDTDISGRHGGHERELKPWIAPTDDGTDLSLESTASTGAWDQFQANESLFGVQSDYDENFYTSRIDRSHPEYKQRAAAAARIAQRMGEDSKDEANEADGLDEEDKYSGVRRDVANYPPLQSTPNRYQPPALRPPSSKPTVAGAPVDPAIISSQIARAGDEKQIQTEKSTTKNAESGSTLDKTLQTENVASSAQKSQNVKSPVATDSNESQPAKSTVVNATVNVEADALKAFRQFSEKQRIRVADDRRQRVMQDKNVKLNDLRGFSKTFKLNTPVPKDLVPILAKDPKKQEAILENAQRNAAEQKAAALKQTQKAAEVAASKQAERRDSAKSRDVPNERVESTRHGPTPRAPQATLPLRDRQPQQTYAVSNLPASEQGLSQRLMHNQRERHGTNSAVVPAPLPIHTSRTPSRPSTNATRAPNTSGSGTLRTPTSATSGKFNVKANEFVPNPAASTFMMPSERQSTSSSPHGNGRARPSSQTISYNEFWGKKRPLPPSERPSILNDFNPLRRLKERAEKDGKAKDYAANGGIAYAHATPVTWTAVNDGEDSGKSYKDMWDELPSGVLPSRSTSASPMNGMMAHQHQLPPHLQQGSHAMPNPQAIYQGGPQHHLYPGGAPPFDERNMHPSPAYGPPRMPAAYPYAIAMGQAMQGQMPNGFQYPGTPGAHPQMMNPGGPQPQPFRQYGPSPQYMPVTGPPLAAPMMVSQGSQGPYMPQPTPAGHVPFYPNSTAPYGTSQPNSGYPSPGRSAPMMMHSGSFQGQNGPGNGPGGQYPPHMYSPAPQANGQMRGYQSPQAQYSQSPQQQFYHPPHLQRNPSHGYGSHPSQMPVPHHAPPSAGEGDGLK